MTHIFKQKMSCVYYVQLHHDLSVNAILPTCINFELKETLPRHNGLRYCLFYMLLKAMYPFFCGTLMNGSSVMSTDCKHRAAC